MLIKESNIYLKGEKLATHNIAIYIKQNVAEIKQFQLRLIKEVNRRTHSFLFKA